MPKTNRRSRWPWLILFILILMPSISYLGWAQPPGQGRGGPGGGDDPGGAGGPGGGEPGGGRPGGPARPQFDPRQAVTIKGEIENLGSYGMTGWRVAPGMAGQGLMLKSEKGKVEVDLGPPGYVAEKGLQLRMGDALEVIGFQVDRGGRTIFIAAAVKTAHRTLRLLDEGGVQPRPGEGPRRPGAGGMEPGRHEPGGMGPDGLGPGGPGPGRF